MTTGWRDNRKCFDVIYLDFSKAFDVLCHKRQKVVVEGTFSEWVEVLSSVIQGSVLGDIFFDIFVGDIDAAVIEALILKFADDKKLAIVIGSVEDGQKS